MLRLVCGHQNYDWGKLGLDSLVFKYRSLQAPGLSPQLPYAELWMGTHPNMPSLVMDDNGEGSVKLLDLLEKDPAKYLGKTAEKFKTKNDLPFLFKILSVAKPLSIQAHPDKKLAELLHKTNPKDYKDGNHKPEMTIALTEFKAFCNFAEPSSIIFDIEQCEDLKLLFTESVFKAFKQEPTKESLRALVEDLFKKSDELVQDSIGKTVKTIEKKEILTQREQLTLQLHKEFPFDIGIFFSYFMNFVVLQPGEALLMEAGEPHCYIFGDCIESMACSDNVVRAGLTPKFKDKKTLCEMLSYKMGQSQYLKPREMKADETKRVLLYESQYEEFITLYLQLNSREKGTPSQEDFHFDFPAIGIVMEGLGRATSRNTKAEMDIKAGDILYFTPQESVSFSSGDNLKVYFCTSK